MRTRRGQGAEGQRRGGVALSQRAGAFACFVLCAFFLSGCAYYSTSATGGSGFGSIAIPLLENTSLEPGIQQALTDSLIQAFVANGALRVVDESQADVVLKGTVTEVREEPFTYQQQADQYQISVFLEMSCYNTRSKQTLWDQKLRGYGIYNAAERREDARRQGLSDAFRILSEDVVDRTQVGGW